MRHCESKATPNSVDQLTQQNVEAVAKLEAATKTSLSLADRTANRINMFCGSMAFVYIHIAWYAAWILLNTVLPARFHFDAYPFSFLTLTVSLEAIFLSAFIMIAQNRQNILSERRAQLDLQINLLSEQENTKMLCLLQGIAQKLGVSHGDEKEIAALAEAVTPENLVRQIDEAAKLGAAADKAREGKTVI